MITLQKLRNEQNDPEKYYFAWQSHPIILFCQTEELSFETYDKLCFLGWDPEIYTILVWINKNIIAKLDNIYYETFGVLIRIATSMLYKTKQKKEDLLLLHNIIVNNLNKMYQETMLSELPF